MQRTPGSTRAGWHEEKRVCFRLTHHFSERRARSRCLVVLIEYDGTSIPLLKVPLESETTAGSEGGNVAQYCASKCTQYERTPRSRCELNTGGLSGLRSSEVGPGSVSFETQVDLRTSPSKVSVGGYSGQDLLFHTFFVRLNVLKFVFVLSTAHFSLSETSDSLLLSTLDVTTSELGRPATAAEGPGRQVYQAKEQYTACLHATRLTYLAGLATRLL